MKARRVWILIPIGVLVGLAVSGLHRGSLNNRERGPSSHASRVAAAQVVADRTVSSVEDTEIHSEVVPVAAEYLVAVVGSHTRAAIAGARVELHTEPSHSDQAIAIAETNSGGTARILTPTASWVHISATGFESVWVSPRWKGWARDEENEVTHGEIRLHRRALVTVTVRGPAGQPIPGARVGVVGPGRPERRSLEAGMLSDSTGGCTVDVPADQSGFVVVEKYGYARAKAEIDQSVIERGWMDVTLDTLLVAGVVVGPAALRGHSHFLRMARRPSIRREAGARLGTGYYGTHGEGIEFHESIWRELDDEFPDLSVFWMFCHSATAADPSFTELLSIGSPSSTMHEVEARFVPLDRLGSGNLIHLSQREELDNYGWLEVTSPNAHNWKDRQWVVRSVPHGIKVSPMQLPESCILREADDVKYRFLLPVGNCKVETSAHRLESVRDPNIEVTIQNGPEPVRVVLPPQARGVGLAEVSIGAVTPYGAPVSAFTLSLSSDGRDGVAYFAKLPGDGAVRLRIDVIPGTYKSYVLAEGYGISSLALTLAPSSGESRVIDVELSPLRFASEE